jgi:hypothetical protein
MIDLDATWDLFCRNAHAAGHGDFRGNRLMRSSNEEEPEIVLFEITRRV